MRRDCESSGGARSALVARLPPALHAATAAAADTADSAARTLHAVTAVNGLRSAGSLCRRRTVRDTDRYMWRITSKALTGRAAARALLSPCFAHLTHVVRPTRMLHGTSRLLLPGSHDDTERAVRNTAYYSV